MNAQPAWTERPPPHVATIASEAPAPGAPFDALMPGQWHGLLARAAHRRLPTGARITPQASPGGGILLLRDGLLRAGTVSTQGKLFTLRLLAPGDTEGEAALLAPPMHPLELAALRPSRVLLLPRRECLALLGANPAFAAAMLRLVSSRLHATHDHAQRLALQPLAGRLADALLRAAMAGQPSLHAGIASPIALSQSELSAMVAASREAVNRLLRQWHAQGIVTSAGGRLVLREPAELQRIRDAVTEENAQGCGAIRPGC